MPEYARVPLTDYDNSDPQSVIEGIAKWVGSQATSDLVDAFGGSMPMGRSEESLEYLEEFSAEHWDFRRGSERHEARQERFDPWVDRLVQEAAYALGMLGTTYPEHRQYDHVLVLGGLFGTCLVRAEYAAELMNVMVDAPSVSGLGSFRLLNDRDHEAAEPLGVKGIRFEVDAMDAAMTRAFGITGKPYVKTKGDPSVAPETSSKILTYESAKGPKVLVVAAASSEPTRRRADTADTCTFWADEGAVLQPGDRVLVVTSAIFVPFQHADAVTTLGLRYRCSVNTVGIEHRTHPVEHDPDGAAIELDGRHYRIDPGDTAKYLQEVRSAIRSMARLHRAAVERLGKWR
jgi:hypothetical protein